MKCSGKFSCRSSSMSMILSTLSYASFKSLNSKYVIRFLLLLNSNIEFQSLL